MNEKERQLIVVSAIIGATASFFLENIYIIYLQIPYINANDGVAFILTLIFVYFFLWVGLKVFFGDNFKERKPKKKKKGKIKK